MSIFSNIKRALGFEPDPDEEEIYRDDVTDTPADAPQPVVGNASPATKAPAAAPADAPKASGADEADDVAAAMMASVVELFNSFQPDFIARCLDPERQKAILVENMTPELKTRLAAIIAAEKEKLSRATASERASLDADLRQLRDRNSELERRRSEFKGEQLSATRQKRALQERIHDLESQVDTLAAEKEQLELENRSMANKIRVAGVCAAAADGSAEAPQTLPDPADKAEIERLTKELESNSEKLTKALADAAEADKRIADAEARAAEADNRAAEAESRVAAANENISRSAREVADFLARLGEAEQRIAEAENAATAARNEAIATIEKKEARIKELKASLAERQADIATIERLEEENRSLRSTIEANLYEHAAEMSRLRKESAESKPRRGRPRKQRSEADADTPAQPKASKKPTISAIDELIEGREWLVAPTPEELTPKAEEPSDDFGYHAPQRKPTIHDNDNQLTLF